MTTLVFDSYPVCRSVFFLFLRIYSHRWVINRSNSFTATKEDPHVEFLRAAFLGALSKVQLESPSETLPLKEEKRGAGVGNSASKGQEDCLKSVWFPAHPICSKKEDEVVLWDLSSVAAFSFTTKQNAFCTMHLCKSRKQSWIWQWEGFPFIKLLAAVVSVWQPWNALDTELRASQVWKM